MYFISLIELYRIMRKQTLEIKSQKEKHDANMQEQGLAFLKFALQLYGFTCIIGIVVSKVEHTNYTMYSVDS